MNKYYKECFVACGKKGKKIICVLFWYVIIACDKKKICLNNWWVR